MIRVDDTTKAMVLERIVSDWIRYQVIEDKYIALFAGALKLERSRMVSGSRFAPDGEEISLTVFYRKPFNTYRAFRSHLRRYGLISLMALDGTERYDRLFGHMSWDEEKQSHILGYCYLQPGKVSIVFLNASPPD